MHFAVLFPLLPLIFASSPVGEADPISRENFLHPWDTTWVLLRQTVNAYAEIVDQKQFGHLDRVFSRNAVAYYCGSYPELQGVTAIRNALTLSYSNVTTQHLVGSKVRIPNDTSVLAASAFQVTIWDRDNRLAGRYSGYYFDRFNRQWQRGGIRGLWSWVIQERQVEFLGTRPMPNGTFGG